MRDYETLLPSTGYTYERHNCLDVRGCLCELGGEAPGLVGSGEVLWQAVQLLGLVIVQPGWSLLHRLGSVS